MDFSHKNVNVNNIKKAFEHFSNMVVSDFDPLGDESRMQDIYEGLGGERLINTHKMGTKSYNGYSSCPLVTGYGKMVLAEFDYDSNFTPDPKLKQMFIKDSSKEHRRLWWLKKYILPRLYWNKMLKGVEV